jgi:hypothetical protein
MRTQQHTEPRPPGFRGFSVRLAIALACTHAQAQKSASDWSFNASATGYIVPQDQSSTLFYVSPVVTADREWLHLEARYNYENLATGSIWFGRNFSFGKEVKVEITPMIGGVFGRTNGVAPGYSGSLDYKRFSLSSVGEFLIATGGEKSFFYSWSEATLSATHWLKAGLAEQHTKAYQTSLNIQRGLIVGISLRRLEFDTYIFNLGWTRPTVVLSASFDF